jgi:FAD/FMN-containing dehydrogenase
MEVKELQRRIEGTVTTSSDTEYKSLRRDMWNQLTPARYPRLIMQAATEHDVVESVRFARAHRMKIAVRGGGHSWVGSSLRDESLLIDLGRLKQLSIEPDMSLATIQPAVTGRELNNQLAVRGLAFPVGHCSSVPLSGYLLNGGLGWNSNRWGPACWSVEAANVVTADGSLVVANQKQHADLLWAVRGAGPGFFAVVTQYLLKLYPVPRAITTSTYVYPLPHIEEIGVWAASVAGQLPSDVELTLFIASAPPDLIEQCRATNGFVCILSATAFLDTTREATAALSLLERCPVAHECLKKTVNQPNSFDSLLDLGAMLWPERHRYLADTLWSNSSPAQPLGIMCEQFLRAPSQRSLAVCVLSTGAGDNVAVRPDTAFSMTAKMLILCYAAWDRPDDDAANSAWHRQTVGMLDSFAVGHYVGESDIVAKPARAQQSFARANWQRLQSIRGKYDPENLFHEWFSATPDSDDSSPL